ncbi:relaxase domain-containing protein [Arthrobacter echini]|uniref:Relaxase domain-containing protein n=2 Tax=Arthrobacter echini TaxID=1529066 RepID=A0A5D0XL63_9MICC|nr:relaxase domain-containing protein [Arthrobacter echini]
MMTVHKLSAGDGYTYYTSEVASADELRAGDRELGDYYTVDGMPPGQWTAHSEQLLGVSGEVTEAQMAALFGQGIHPNAKALIAENGSGADTALGRKYARYTAADTEMTKRLAEEHARVRRTTGVDPDKAQEHEIRFRVAGELFRETHGRDAKSNEELARFATVQTTPKQQTVAGYDLVFAPAKSVSLLWALGGDEARKTIEAAHQEAIAETITFLEDNATYTRRGQQGIRQIDVDGGLVATQFRHYDSRAGDPQLHDHVVIANKVLGSDGKWSSLDGRTLYKMNVAASETYNAKIIEKVCASLGVSPVARATGRGEPVYEIAGIDLDAIEHASSRRMDIAGAITRLETEFTHKHGYAPNDKQKIALAQQATLETRPTKKSARRLSELVPEWQDDYRTQLGMPIGKDLLEHVQAASITPRGPLVADLNVHDHARLVVHELSGKRATWGRHHVIAQTRRHLKEAFPGQTITDDTVMKVTDAGTAAHSLQVTPDSITPKLYEFTRADGMSQYRQADSALYTSHEVLAAEDKILAAAQRTIIPAVSTERFEQVLAARTEALTATGGVQLSDAQINLARVFATDEKLLALGIGPAGAGKTTSLSLAADAVRASGGRVIGLAPTAAAAAVMSSDIGADANTIDAFIYTHQNTTTTTGSTDTNTSGADCAAGAAPGLRAGDVIIVDEAGMVSTPRLADVVAVAARHGAVVRVIGDDRQLGAIGSGGALRLLNTDVGAVRLEEVHRFTSDGEAAASLALREPPTVGADTPFHWYLENKRVVAGTTEAMTDTALRAWMTDRGEGKTSLLIATDNATVTDLNARAQAARIATGELTDNGAPITNTTVSVVLGDGLRAYTGDTIVTRKNDRTLQLNQGKDFVKNNDVWTIDSITTGTPTAPSTSASSAPSSSGFSMGGGEKADGEWITLRHAGHNALITVDADYLNRHGQLGYAATVHRAQGATVDTAHAILDETTDRAGAYVAATRGREHNQLYIGLGDGTEQDTTRDTVLDTITAAHDRSLSAHETTRAEAVRVGDVSTLSSVYIDVENGAWVAKTRQIAADVLGPKRAAQFTSLESWGAVAAHMRTAHDQGLNPATLLGEAVNMRNFAKAKDVSAVLAWRLEQRVEEAGEILANAGRRPLGAISDDHLHRLADQAAKRPTTTTTTTTEAPRPELGEARLDPQWAARPYAHMRTQRLTEAHATTSEQVRGIHPAAAVDLDTRKTLWKARTMGAELERRATLSPAQTAIERTTRGEDPRTAHQITVAEAIKHEQEVRHVALPPIDPAVARPDIVPATVSEDLAPTGLSRDRQVPASYRAELDRLRVHLGDRIIIRGTQLAEETPAWTAAIGPVPARTGKADEWYSIAAETEAYRNKYNIGAHETTLIPKQYRQDPVAQRLIARATALHKHSALTNKPPISAEQTQQRADEAAITERMNREQAAAQRVIDRFLARRATSSDPLPEPQQREARIVDAISSETPATTDEKDTAAAERVLARHRAATDVAAQKSQPTTPGTASGNESDTAPDPQKPTTKEPAMSQDKDAATRTSNPGGLSQRQVELINSRKASAAERQARERAAQKDASSVARRAADAADRSSGRSL